MRTAGSFKIEKDKTIDNFIENYVYTKLDEEIHPVILYVNVIKQDYIDIKALQRRLKELKFIVTKNVVGTDDVLEIRIK